MITILQRATHCHCLDRERFSAQIWPCNHVNIYRGVYQRIYVVAANARCDRASKRRCTACGETNCVMESKHVHKSNFVQMSNLLILQRQESKYIMQSVIFIIILMCSSYHMIGSDTGCVRRSTSGSTVLRVMSARVRLILTSHAPCHTDTDPSAKL